MRTRPGIQYNVDMSFATTSPEWVDTLFDKIYAAYNEQDAEATADCYAEDLEILVNGEPGPSDREGFIEGLREQWRGFPDVLATEVHRLITGDRVITEMTIEGRNTAEFLDRPATGKVWKVTVAWVCQVTDGRVAVMRIYADNAPMQSALRVG
jgi:predicted ester cyclase